MHSRNVAMKSMMTVSTANQFIALYEVCVEIMDY